MRKLIKICEVTDPASSVVAQIEREAAMTGVHIELHAEDDWIGISWIGSGSSQKGAAAHVLTRLAELADQYDLRLSLAVLDSSPGLIRYYHRFGFRATTLDDAGELRWLSDLESRYDAVLHTDDDFDEETTMSREPQSSPLTI